MNLWKLSEISRVLGLDMWESDETLVKKISTDSRSIGTGDLYLALRGESFNGDDFALEALRKGAVACICSSDISAPKGSKIAILTDTKEGYLKLAAAHRKRLDLKLVAVTGSAGKTTTKEMIFAALSDVWRSEKTKENLNNELGAAQTILSTGEETEVLILEMGMDRQGDIKILSDMARPDIAVITNIGLSHIEYLKTQENIFKAKMEIISGLKALGTLILNYDDKFLKDVKNLGETQILSYGFDNPKSRIKGENFTEDFIGLSSSFDIHHGGKVYYAVIPCLGIKNASNALAAYAVAHALGRDVDACVRGLSAYEVSGMRQKTSERSGIFFIEDCYNANPDSMKAALELLAKISSVRSGKNFAVIGDMLELSDISQKEHEKIYALAKGFDKVFLYGNETLHTLNKANKEGATNFFHFSDKKEIAAILTSDLQKGDSVLFKGSRGNKLETIILVIYSKM